MIHVSDGCSPHASAHPIAVFVHHIGVLAYPILMGVIVLFPHSAAALYGTRVLISDQINLIIDIGVARDLDTKLAMLFKLVTSVLLFFHLLLFNDIVIIGSIDTHIGGLFSIASTQTIIALIFVAIPAHCMIIVVGIIVMAVVMGI